MARVGSPTTDKRAPAEILVAHQWKSIDREGRFVCKSGCVVEVYRTERITDVEAQHQAQMLALVESQGDTQP